MNSLGQNELGGDCDSEYAETRELLVELAAEANGFNQAVGGSVTGAVADWLAARYLSALKQRLDGKRATPEDERRWQLLRSSVQDWALMRRGDHSAVRLTLEREELELLKANSQAQKEKEFAEWLKRPEVREKYFSDEQLTPEAREKRYREIFGLA